MDAIELALRKCLHGLVSSTTITERKRNVETFVDLLKDNRIHPLLDDKILDENSMTWNEIFTIIREYTVNELASIRTKSNKTISLDTKYQETLKLFKTLIENANKTNPQLDGRSLLESILSILTSDAWSTCCIIIKELSHLLIHHVLCFHKYLNELREQEWIDLCHLYMSLSRCSNKTFSESEQAVYSSHLKFIIENVVNYNDLNSMKSTIRTDVLQFLQIEIGQMKNSNHFSLIEHILCSLNCWSFKYLFDMPEEIFQLGNELLPTLIDIWRRKCNEKSKTEIIKFSQLQMSIHHPTQRKNIFEVYDEIWLKNLRDLNDLLLREINEICHKQRSINRQNSNEFLIRFDLLYLASSVFYQITSLDLAIKTETNNNDDDDGLFEPSAKRTRYEHSMSITTNLDAQMKTFQNLFQSIDSYHQAVGFQILSLQIERNMSFTKIDCDYYLNILKRYLTDERRSSLIINALRCLSLLLTRTQLTSDLILLVQPLIHNSLYESYVLEILSEKNLSLMNLFACSSMKSLEYLFYWNETLSNEDEMKFIEKFLPNLICSYRNNEHDLTLFFSTYSPEWTWICACILMKICSFDLLPKEIWKTTTTKKLRDNQFEQIEFEWSRLKLFIPFDQKRISHSICLDLPSTCEFNLNMFKLIVEIFDRNIRFLQQLKDKHLGERYKQILHYAFLGIFILDILQKFFSKISHPNEFLHKFIENIQILFTELIDETNFLYTKSESIPFIEQLFIYIQNALDFSSSQIPSALLYGFLDAKFLSYLYNYSTRQSTENIEGIHCPIDQPLDGKFQAFEILLSLCYQSLFDEEFSSSFLFDYGFNCQSNRNLFLRIFDEKLSIYLDELQLPNPISYQYLNIYLSYFNSHCSLTYRLVDFELVMNIYSEIFRTYRRDIRLCQRFLLLFECFLRRFNGIIREKFHSNEQWIHLRKLIDAFWQMTINQNQYLNQNSRKSIVNIKQILINEQPIEIHECHSIFNDSSYIVRLAGYELARNFFVEHLRLKSSNEQKDILDYFLHKTPSALIFFYSISSISEYLRYSITFYFFRLTLEKKLSDELFQHLLPKNVSIGLILQFYQWETPFKIQDFPWYLFPMDSKEKSQSMIFANYFLSSPSDRQELHAMFSDLKSAMIEYFPQLQANLFVILTKKQGDNYRDLIEKILTKTEYNRLIKLNLTKILSLILLTYHNDDQANPFFDPWSPQPILPANNWTNIKHTLEYIRQIINGKNFIEILLKLTDIGEILLVLSSNLFSTDSLHEELRLLEIFSLFLIDILLPSLDNDYLHSILRDSTYILLRYLKKHSRRKSEEIYQEELNDKIRQLTCQLLDQLCSKGLQFQPDVYRHHIPDIISTLIDHEKSLTKQRIEKIFNEIYRYIKRNTDPIFIFLTHIIEKLGYVSIPTTSNSSSINTFHYLTYLSHHRLSQWCLELFHQYLENEREISSINIDSKIISHVKQQLLDCLKSRTNHILAGKCLAKCQLFFSSLVDDDHLDEDPYEFIPFWILDHLILVDLIDSNQSIVECTRSTLKSLFQHPIGQDFYHKHPKENLIPIYTKPFLSPVNLSTKFIRNFTNSSLVNPWLISREISFDRWLIFLINHLIEQIDIYYNEKKETGHPYAHVFLQLISLMQFKIEFAKKIFPHLITCLLFLPTNHNLRIILSEKFIFIIEQLISNQDEQNCLYHEIGQLIFRTMNFLRQCPMENFNKRNQMKTSMLNFQNHFWLDIDYFQLAKCASKYQCYQSAIIYTDIWTTKQRSILSNNDYLTHLYYSDIDLLSSTCPELVDLFVRLYSNRNHSDEFYGLDRYFQNHPNLNGEFNQLNKNYSDSLFYFDQSALNIDSSKLIQSLRFCGLNHILEQYLHQISSLSNEIFYRIQLTSILTKPNHLTKWQANEHHSIRNDLLDIVQRQIRLPSSTIPQLINHQLWSNVSDFQECLLVNMIDDLTQHYQTPNNLRKLWLNPSIDEHLFDQNDEIFLTRVTLTDKFFVDQDQRDFKQTFLADLLTQLCQNAFDCKKLQLCERYLNDFSSLISPSYSHELTFLRAQVLVVRQQDTAGEYLRQLIESSTPKSIEIRCRLLLCDWLNKTRCETSSTIKQQLDAISMSIQTLDRSSISLIFESYLAMAYFSDNEYQRLNQLFHSPIFENKRLLISKNQIEYNKQEKLDPTGRYTKVLKRSLDMDKKEIDEQKKLQYSYLISTLNNYLISLKFFSHLSKHQSKSNEILSKKNSVPEIMITSKCLSYWLTNCKNEDVNKTLKKYLLPIPTHFFLPFVYQMAARMALTNEQLSPFHSILLEYLSQCILDHPHHVLPVIFALVNAQKDAHINQTPAKKTTTTSEVIQLNYEINHDPRSRAAQYLLEKCAKDKPQLVDQMRKLNDAYIEAAYWEGTPVKADQSGKTPVFSKQLRLMHIKKFHEIAIPTINIPVAPDGNYRNIESIEYFNPEYAMVGGVNAPKKLICHSSTGRQLPQLLKGKDDLRQDAVMQQLFTVVNRLLDKDDLTAHRALHIRTYKVVPLTQKSGVLEWCEGTITFGDYLAKEREGAHSRYHPEDWTAMDCRRHIHKATNLGKDERKRAFIHACSKLKPVFRYFFYEYYNQPSLWHSRKQIYAKSVATSSIVGYIVGLGDRHVQNILIDTQSAEVIHIDLGVAFDQGKMLPIPEAIPFRLTRDVIDGLGICGTEGLFKKTCEITLELMRQYADTLVTIIEVFLYDPLYQWQLSPQKALQLQQQLDRANNDSSTPASNRSSGKGSMPPPPSLPSQTTASSTSIAGESVATDTNKMAERLLLGLRQKLQGVERLNQMTIKAHVNMLIQEATNIDNLSQLFAGWQPYL